MFILCVILYKSIILLYLKGFHLFVVEGIPLIKLHDIAESSYTLQYTT